jgi:hypothetical protein
LRTISHFAPLLFQVNSAGFPADAGPQVTLMQQVPRSWSSKKTSIGRASAAA